MQPIFVRRASLEDIAHVANNLLPEDRAEVEAISGLIPEIALPSSWHPSREMYVGGLADDVGNPGVAWGVDPVMGVPDVGQVWLLATPMVPANPVEFTVQLRKSWREIHDKYEFLTNYADARNERHLRFLKWLGCYFVRTIPLGPYGLPFIEFLSVR